MVSLRSIIPVPVQPHAALLLCAIAACGGPARPAGNGTSPTRPRWGPPPSSAAATTAPAASVTPPAAPRAARITPVVGVSGYVIEPGKQGDSGLGHYRTTRTYRDALVKAGAAAVRLLPVPDAEVATVLDRVDCLVLGGGPDIDPAAYGEPAHPSVTLLPRERQQFDFALAREAIRRRMPVLGICLGSQELNVTLGGRLIQDIPSEVTGSLSHRQLDVEDLRRGVHEVQLVAGTRLATIYGDRKTMRVNSAHHQASEVLGQGLVVAARSPDGVVEGYEAPRYPFLVGVQFHPEIQTDPPGLHESLFREFVAACARYAAQH